MTEAVNIAQEYDMKTLADKFDDDSDVSASDAHHYVEVDVTRPQQHSSEAVQDLYLHSALPTTQAENEDTLSESSDDNDEIFDAGEPCFLICMRQTLFSCCKTPHLAILCIALNACTCCITFLHFSPEACSTSKEEERRQGIHMKLFVSDVPYNVLK